MTATMLGAEVLASNPGPVLHLGVLAGLVLAGVAVFVTLRRGRRRDSADAEPFADDHPSTGGASESPDPDEDPSRHRSSR